MAIRKLFCNNCKIEQEVVLSDAGPHIKASCSICGSYIKFVSPKELQKKTKGKE